MGVKDTARFTPLALFLGALILGAPVLPACGDDSKDDPPPGKELVKPDPALDPVTTIRRGPWLNAPSAGVVTLSWTTDVASSSRVELTPEGGQAQVVEGIVFRPVSTIDDPILAGTLPTTFQHEVVLDGLISGQRYNYRILSAGDPKPEGSFLGPPELGDDFQFFLFGDTRTNDASHTEVISSMADLIAREGPVAFILHTGDMVSTGSSEDQWDEFFVIEGPLLKESPILPVYGNHEAILGRTTYEGIFANPPSSTSPSDRWYSVDMGDLHIAVLDPYCMEFEPHLDWLEEDLASSTAKFKILAVHS
ncbi:MAG: metallophosphoesterase, partial [Polyangia bacterium]|nr:metallophosphoesterase [Polyangia bacterium]